MSLTEQINEDLKNAMKARNEGALRALRGIKSALLLAKTSSGAGDEVSEEQGLAILQKLAKQRRESIEIYKTQNRADLLATETEELEIIEKYLPKQMSADDVRKEIAAIIAETGAKNAGEIGKVMPVAMKKLAGKADGKMISEITRELLS